MSLPLSGICVLDLTHMLAGPFCTKMLADFGADVIKIERPGTGDESRAVGPFVNGESMYFIDQNRNKKSVVLDLFTEEGHTALLRLAHRADVVVENFRPGTMEKLGIGYETLKAENPTLIFASCSGYGKKGPLAKMPAYDGTIQAISGTMGITGKAGGEYSKVGPSIISTMSGLMLSIGILAALCERDNSGLGQEVDVAMYDCIAAMLENPLVRYFNKGIIPKPLGNSNPAACPFSSFHTANGDIVIATTTDDHWRKLCEALEHAELTDDPRFVTMDKRAANWGELESILNAILRTKTMTEWIRILRDNNIVCGTINTMRGLLEDPQVVDRHMILDMEHPVAGPVKVIGIPVKFSRTPCTIHMPSPGLGEHTEEVLSTLV